MGTRPCLWALALFAKCSRACRRLFDEKTGQRRQSQEEPVIDASWQAKWLPEVLLTCCKVIGTIVLPDGGRQGLAAMVVCICPVCQVPFLGRVRVRECKGRMERDRSHLDQQWQLQP